MLVIPTGLATVRPFSSCIEGLSAPRTAYAAVRPTASQVTGRQRGDSDRPVGNSSSGNTSASRIVGGQIQFRTQFATSGPGSDPGWALA
jgi:hypothetical protein